MWDANGTPIGSFDPPGPAVDQEIRSLVESYLACALACAKGSEPLSDLDLLHRTILSTVQRVSP